MIGEYLDKVMLRKVEQAARYITTAMKRGRSEETIKAKVERIMRTYAELTVSPVEGQEVVRRS